MNAASFEALGARVRALKEAPPARGWFDRARSRLSRVGDVLPEQLRRLDGEFDAVGLHSAQDVRLLRELGATTGRLATLAAGLSQRARVAEDEFLQVLAVAEQRWQTGELTDAAREELAQDLERLSRVAKVAAIFEGGARGPFVITRPPSRSRGAAPQSALLASVEFLYARASQNALDTQQKRRDLDAAHELLLRLGQVSQDDRARARTLRIDVAEARRTLAEAPLVRSLDELLRHVRHTARRDPSTAYRSLRALYQRAVDVGDEALAKAASAAVDALLPGRAQLAEAVERSRLARELGLSTRELPSGPGPGALPPGGVPGVADALGDLLRELAFDLDGDRRKALELARGCARFFDVDDALAESLPSAELSSTRPVQRRVPYPTQRMSYEFTGSLTELNNFVISHPGTLALDLASNRQLVRSYLEEEPPPKERKVLRTAVRVYVLDASGSMHGGRARFRDAILIAELNALRVRARLGLPFDPLFFSYFNDSPTELVRVDTADAATRHIDKLFARSPAEGQTDITLALMSAFESIAQAQGRDPYLARATVVLVTDGEDGVDQELLRRVRRPLAGVDIALSFISLGEENQDLKTLVLEQRDRGGRAFYHHLTDAEIALARTEFDRAPRTLLPADVPITPDALERLLPALDALERVAQDRAHGDQPLPDVPFASYFTASGPSTDGPKDELVADLLEALAETAAYVPAEARPREAVALLRHLLDVYRLPLDEFRAALGSPASRIVAARARFERLCSPLA